MPSGLSAIPTSSEPRTRGTKFSHNKIVPIDASLDTDDVIVRVSSTSDTSVQFEQESVRSIQPHFTSLSLSHHSQF